MLTCADALHLVLHAAHTSSAEQLQMYHWSGLLQYHLSLKPIFQNTGGYLGTYQQATIPLLWLLLMK